MRQPRRHARGNTLILVTAILVLLVIIATAFLVRAQSGRAQAAAQQKAAARGDRVEAIASQIAQEVADALFVKRVDRARMADQVAANVASGLGGSNLEYLARSDYPRLPAEPLAVRYGVDYFDFFDNRTIGGPPATPGVVTEDGFLDGYNYAPYVVSPFTNPPARYGNVPGDGGWPVGNPGFGDTRWLASTEPMRARLVQQVNNPVAPAPPNAQVPLPFNPDWGNLALNAQGAPILDPEGLGFSHWPHLSWIATAENGYRVAWNIASLEGFPAGGGSDFLGNDPGVLTGTPGTVAGELALGIPYEQWNTFAAPREARLLGKDPATGFLVLDRDDWRQRVREWFNVGIGTLNLNARCTHEQIIRGVDATGNALGGPAGPARRAFALPNFLQLGAFGTPADEFKVVPLAAGVVPTSRNLISRTFADADGDGWTDSFWFLAPASSDRGTRQLVAVRIIDNSSMINVNTATRFERSNTIGATPADVALATRRESYDESVTAGRDAGFRDPIVGFFNSRENDPEYRVNFKFWPDSSTPTTAPQLVYAVASDGQTPPTPTAGVDVGWDRRRWEGSRTQVALPGATAADPYSTGFLRSLGVITEGRAADANAVLPFFDTSADYGITPTSPTYGDLFVLTRPADRLNYFKAMANGGEVVDPVTAARATTLTPFGSDDEVELRSANGLNSPQTISRLEASLNGSGSLTASDVVFGQFMRSTRSREETARFFDPDDVRVQDWRARGAWTGPAATFAARSGAELLLDHRRLMTTISGARNELLPQRLWTVVNHSTHNAAVPDELFTPPDVTQSRPAFTRRGFDVDGDGAPDDVTGDGVVNLADDLAPYHPNIMFPAANFVQPGANNGFGIAVRDANGDGRIDVNDFERARKRFLVDNRKIDLRRPNDVPVFDPAINGYRPANELERLQADRKWTADIQRVMRRALIDNDTRQNYFGRPFDGQADVNKSLATTKMMTASVAANAVAWRDAKRRVTNLLYLDQPRSPTEAVLVPQDALPAGVTSAGFIGVEKQPFLQEVFMAFVYPKRRLSQADITAVVDPDGDGIAAPGCPDPANCQVSATDPFALPPCTANGAGEHFVDYDENDPSTWPAVVFAVQVANPYNEPVNLADFELRINPEGNAPQRFFFGLPGPAGTKSGNIHGPDVELGPCTPEEPRSAIVFCVPRTYPNGDPFPRDAWLDYLDLRAPVTEFDPANDTQPGQPFEPDANALFSPAWGSLEAANRRGGTLLFDATAAAGYPGLDVSGDIRNRWKPQAGVGGAPPANSFIELRRGIFSAGGGQAVFTVVDRWENELDPDLDGQAGARFSDLVNRLFINAGGGSLPPPPSIQCRSGSLAIDGVRIRGSDSFVSWARSGRQWLFDTQNGIAGTNVPGRGVISLDERAPRWVFARATGTMASSNQAGGAGAAPGVETFVGGTEDVNGRQGHVLVLDTAPDAISPSGNVTYPISSYFNMWGDARRGKPVFFPTRIAEGGNARRYDYPAWGTAFNALPPGMQLSHGEKGVSRAEFVNGTDPDNFVAPLRMYQKDADFDHAAEIFDLPMWGPMVQPGTSGRTYATLPEILAQPVDSDADILFPKSPKPTLSTNIPAFGSFPSQLNHLLVEPPQFDTVVDATNRPNYLQGIQVLPSSIPPGGLATAPPQQNGLGFNTRLVGGSGLLDAFVCDDRGAQPFDTWTTTSAPDGRIDVLERAAAEDRRPRLARNFEGKLTPGLININTAPVEVLRAMPQMTRLVYDDDFPIVRTADSAPAGLYQLNTPLGLRRTVRDATYWQLAPYDMSGGNPGPGSPGSIQFDYGVTAPRVRVAEAIELWRNKLNVTPDLNNNLFANMPSYYSRGTDLPVAANHREWAAGAHSWRGFESLGELALLTRGAEFTPNPNADANGNGVPDVQDIMLRKASDVNRNNIDDAFDATGQVGSSWNQAVGWSVRMAGMDPYRTRWDDRSWGKGAGALVDPTLGSLGGTGLKYVDGIPKAITPGTQQQVFPLTGRTAIDKHLLVVATDDRGTPGVVETNDPTNDGLNTGGSTKYIETKAYRHDQTSGDAVEQTQLLKGISNIATVRSDVFTVWVRIRTIKQDRLTGQWNGTDPELIVDDSRYMMTVDRSSVDRPGEQPRIVSFVKVTN